jgi:hypothetical protein
LAETAEFLRASLCEVPDPPSRPEPIHHRGLQPDQALATLIGLGLDGHAAERERPGNRLEGNSGFDRATGAGEVICGSIIGLTSYRRFRPLPRATA